MLTLYKTRLRRKSKRAGRSGGLSAAGWRVGLARRAMWRGSVVSCWPQLHLFADTMKDLVSNLRCSLTWFELISEKPSRPDYVFGTCLGNLLRETKVWTKGERGRCHLHLFSLVSYSLLSPASVMKHRNGRRLRCFATTERNNPFWTEGYSAKVRHFSTLILNS